MKKYTIFILPVFLMVGFMFFNFNVLANGDDDHSIAVEEEITTADLGIEDPGLLPSSPFYFFKQWSRGLQKAFTFNSVAKAELELRFANEQAAEAKELAETEPENTSAINEAFENYQKSHERLRERIEGLKELSDNPNIDRLIDNLVEKSVIHERLFNEIAQKFENKEDVKNAIRAAREGLEESLVAGAHKDSPEKFVKRLENAVEKSKKGDLSHFLHSIESIDRIQNRAPEEFRDLIGAFRDDLSVKLEERLKTFAEGRDEEEIQRFIKGVPGDKARRTVILEEIRERTGGELGEKLLRAREVLEKEVIDGGDIKENAKEQINRAERIIEKLESITAGLIEVPDNVTALLSQAKDYVSRARFNFRDERYGSAFGQAQSAEALARNALRIIENYSAVNKDREDELEKREKISCIEIYRPVCGSDGETYSNECFARTENVRIKHVGKCMDIENEETKIIPREITPTPELGEIFRKPIRDFLGR